MVREFRQPRLNDSHSPRFPRLGERKLASSRKANDNAGKGAVGHAVCERLIKQGFAVRAMVREADDRSARLAEKGAEIVVGNLLDLQAVHRAIEGCDRIYFGMSVSPSYLEATINTATVAKHHNVKAFVNISQMTVSEMSVTVTTDSPQQKLHWLAEQALDWSGLPVVHVRPTAFLDTFFSACPDSPSGIISRSGFHLAMGKFLLLRVQTWQKSSRRFCRILRTI